MAKPELRRENIRSGVQTVRRMFASEQPMTTNFVSNGLAVRFVLAVAMGLSLGSVVHLHASVVELMAVRDDTHSSDSGAPATDRSGVCEREAEKLLGL